jgi:hypothetical protein
MENTIVDAQTRVELYKQAKEFIVKEGGVYPIIYSHVRCVKDQLSRLQASYS